MVSKGQPEALHSKYFSLSLTPVHPPHKCGLQPEVSCVQSARANPPCLLGKCDHGFSSKITSKCSEQTEKSLGIFSLFSGRKGGQINFQNSFEKQIVNPSIPCACPGSGVFAFAVLFLSKCVHSAIVPLQSLLYPLLSPVSLI